MIDQLVRELPEIYQPIYAHPELSQHVSRPCEDRLERVLEIHDALRAAVGRPLNILDLGCAQGYFSFNLAKRGSAVLGVDYLDKNIAVCNALAQKLSMLNASFEVDKIENFVERVDLTQFDMVLGLSVFHHIIHESGIDKAQVLVSRIVHQCGVLVAELALREEPLYWASSLPNNPRILLDSSAFVFEVAKHATHLAPIPRPLYIASNRFWVINGRAEQFDVWSTEPHALAMGTHIGSRRYYFSSRSVLKYYSFNHERGEHNKAEFAREKQFLLRPPPAFSVPSYSVFEEKDSEAWSCQERLPGRLLLDILREGGVVDHRAVLLSVLKQLQILESVGLYHDDVRTWNVLVSETGTAYLIDYGAISISALDCAWPSNRFFSFLVFVRELATGIVDEPEPLRTIAISPYRLPEPYGSWARRLWKRPLAEWSFQLMYESLLEHPMSGSGDFADLPDVAWIRAMEEGLQVQKLFAMRLRSKLAPLEGLNEEVISVTEQLAKIDSCLSQLNPLFVEQQQRILVHEEQLRQFAKNWENCLRYFDEHQRLVDSRVQQVEAKSQQAETLVREYNANILQAQALAQALNSRAEEAESRLFSVQSEFEARREELSQSQMHCLRLEHRVAEYSDKIEKLEKSLADELVKSNNHRQIAEGRAAEISALTEQIATDKKLMNSTEGACTEARVQLIQKQIEIDYWHGRVLQLHASTSWFITKPIRFAKRKLMGARGEKYKSSCADSGAKTSLQVFQMILAHGIRFVYIRPRLRMVTLKGVKIFPRLHIALRDFGIKNGAIPVLPCDASCVSDVPVPAFVSVSDAKVEGTGRSLLVSTSSPVTHQTYKEVESSMSMPDADAIVRVRQRLQSGRVSQ